MVKSVTLISFVSVGLLSGCTSIQVQPVSTNEQMLHVCIQNNPAVQVVDFVDVLQRGLERQAISSEVFSNTQPARCQYVLTYTARRSWDMAPYLSEAYLRISRDGKTVANAEYHLRMKGGFSLTKWQSTETKMRPVIDKLLGARST